MPSLQIPLSNASGAASRPPPHGSGPGWFATPSLYDSFIRYSMPVYPGASRLTTCPTRLEASGSPAASVEYGLADHARLHRTHQAADHLADSHEHGNRLFLRTARRRPL